MYSNEILRGSLTDSISSSMGMEIEDAEIVEDLDPKHTFNL
jgi:hypothetical protein